MPDIKSFPNNQDQYIGAEHVMRWHHGRTSGVFGAQNNAAVVAVAGSMAVTVSDGLGWLSNSSGDGVVWWNDSESQTGAKLNLSIDTADGVLHRIDRVIVSWETTNYVARPTVTILKGENSSTPVAPGITNSDILRQISLAQIYVAAGTLSIDPSMITDERLDTSVCGLVTDTVSVDTSMMKNQFDAFMDDSDLQYSTFMSESEQSYNDFMTQSNEAFTSFMEGSNVRFNSFMNDSGTTLETFLMESSTNFDALMSDSEQRVEKFLSESDQEFVNWFDSIKDTLENIDVSDLLLDIEEVRTIANNAATAAQEANVAAQTANTTANEAKSAAQTAQTTANSAQTAAQNAQTTADSKAPMYSYGTEDLTAGESELATGELYFVYE